MLNSENYNNIRVCALVVTFNPELEVLRCVLDTLSKSVSKIFIFDNTINNSIINFYDFELAVPIEIHSNSVNVGIAAAQNFLITCAHAEGFDFSVLSDQDTFFPDQYVFDLIPYFNVCRKVAAVVPGWVDVNLQGEAEYPSQFVFDSNNRLKVVKFENGVIEISHAISSGMLLNLKYLPDIGLMKEELFIDWVDNEWCWRARGLGFMILAVPSIKVKHTLGESTVKVFGRNFVKRATARNFYIVRNALYLAIYSNIPLSVKLYLAIKAIHHTIFSLLSSDHKFIEICYISKAWLHGLGARLGKIN